LSAKHSAEMKERWKNPEYRSAQLTRLRSPETEAKRIAKVKVMWKDKAHHSLGTEKAGTLQATTSPNTRDIAWAAGFLEGEGSFYNSSHRTRPGSVATYVTAYQNNPEPLERMLSFFGGALHQRAPRPRSPNPVWVWRASGSRARGICMTLFSLMSGKRKKQIREALNGK
jgi:hypothetical protein